MANDAGFPQYGAPDSHAGDAPSPGVTVLDPKTGELVLASTAERIGPALMREAFTHSRLRRDASLGTVNEPWVSYALYFPAGEVAPFAARVGLRFHGETLDSIDVMDASPAFGRGWEDWDMEKETARLASNNAWLDAAGVPPGSYSWGTVVSDYDARTGISSTTLRYARGTQ